MGSKRGGLMSNHVRLYNGIRLRTKEGVTTMGEPQTHDVEQKNPDTKEYILHDAICMKFRKSPN